MTIGTLRGASRFSLQRFMAGLDRIHPAALVHDLAHQLGNAFLRKTAEGQPLTLVLEIAEGAQ